MTRQIRRAIDCCPVLCLSLAWLLLVAIAGYALWWSGVMS